MPSLDTIRTVTIRGQADGVDQTRAALDRLTASLNAANQNLAQTRQVANDNASGFALTGESAVSAANHLRQAAEAAYAFSPAFRSVVNEMAAPALKGAAVALEGVAAGMVTATNVAGTGVVRLGTAIETTFPAFAVLGANVKVAGAAMEAFSPTLGGVAASILSRLLPALSLLGKGLLIVDAVRLLTEAWRLGNERLAEYVAIAEKAATSGLSTDFYQRITRAAEDAKTPVEALTEAFKKLSQAAGPDLGGTAAQNRLKALVDAGNFGGNSGISDLKNANSNEERLRALATLYDSALEKGQRLAALDLVKAFGGDQLAANLAKDSGYLDKLLESADEIAGKELISAGDIQRAVELQNRLDAAEKILSQRWHPIQELLADLGVKMKETWISIVEAIANAVDAVFKLGQRIADALAPALGFLQQAGQLIGKAAPYLAQAPGGVGLPLAVGAASLGVLSTPSSTVDQESAQRQAQLADARKRLAEAMNRKFDSSKAPQTDEGKDAYDRATESILKYIEVTKAAAETVGLSVAEQEKAKVVAQLTAAAMKDGTPITAALRTEMQKLGDQASAAAEALEKAKIASDIKFGRNTALLSQEDVQIATALKGLYPDVATALGSVEAQGMRTNDALKSMSSAIETNLTSGLADITTGSKTAGQAFSDMGNTIVRALEEMIIKIAIVQPLMRALQQSIGGGGLSGLFGGGSSGGTGFSLTGTGGLYHSGGIVGAEPTSLRAVNDNMFAGAPRFHTGGIAGDEVPIIAKRGEGVFTPGQMAAMGGGSKAPQVNVTLIERSGADGAVKQSQNSNGGIDIEIAVAQIAAKSAAQPGGALNRVLTDQLGGAQRLASR
ncbi:hypothetical protein [Bradyrhizobium japonicum]|uniref:hypothetical protein n=1 Tax=Bradyrhizobium japonicum TaxID=375 RepID=UPI000693F714|nr:hypothetical protein [Bradyrhizobium japonicum]